LWLSAPESSQANWLKALIDPHGWCHPKVEFWDISTKLPIQSKIHF
jgi:hypothetical protein